jgi:hypothetical protein
VEQRWRTDDAPPLNFWIAVADVGAACGLVAVAFSAVAEEADVFVVRTAAGVRTVAGFVAGVGGRCFGGLPSRTGAAAGVAADAARCNCSQVEVDAEVDGVAVAVAVAAAVAEYPPQLGDRHSRLMEVEICSRMARSVVGAEVEQMMLAHALDVVAGDYTKACESACLVRRLRKYVGRTAVQELIAPQVAMEHDEDFVVVAWTYDIDMKEVRIVVAAAAAVAAAVGPCSDLLNLEELSHRVI